MKLFSSGNPVGSAARGVPTSDYIHVGMLSPPGWNISQREDVIFESCSGS